MNSRYFLEKIKDIVHNEQRPSCFRDFLFFELDGKEIRYKYGTIRNILSKLRQMGKIERVYNSGIAFHTLKVVKVGKSITSNHTEDSLSYTQRSLMKFLYCLETDKPAIHDIHLKFPLRGVWPILSSSPSNLIINKDEKYSKDITIKEIIHDNFKIKMYVHQPNTVSIVISCTDNPISIDDDGILKISTGLARAEERLQTIILDLLNNERCLVPSHMSWTVTMWHFGQDSLAQYSGKSFEMNWQDSLGVFRVYLKKRKEK